jgi:hypothetical protein
VEGGPTNRQYTDSCIRSVTSQVQTQREGDLPAGAAGGQRCMQELQGGIRCGPQTCLWHMYWGVPAAMLGVTGCDSQQTPVGLWMKTMRDALCKEPHSTCDVKVVVVLTWLRGC